MDGSTKCNEHCEAECLGLLQLTTDNYHIIKFLKSSNIERIEKKCGTDLKCRREEITAQTYSLPESTAVKGDFGHFRIWAF